MHLVDTPTAVSSLPAIQPEGAPGHFVKGSTDGSQPATVPGQDWFNMVQQELYNVVTGAGLEPDQTKGDFSQLFQAILQLSGLGVPYLHVGETPPAGSLECCDDELSRVTNERLWDWINRPENNFKLVSDDDYLNNGMFGAFSTGDGATTFRAPNFRGQFLRAWDNGEGVDPGRVMGEFQDVKGADISISTQTFETQLGTIPVIDAVRFNDTVFNDNTEEQVLDLSENGFNPKNISVMYCIKY